jgi:uncharacterized protein involved in tellurium resistance
MPKFARISLCLFCALCVFGAPALANGVDWQSGYVEAEGVGLPPPRASTPLQARALAEKAARLDACRNLLGLATAIKLDAYSEIKTLYENDRQIKLRLEGFVQNAAVVGKQPLYDGACRVVMRAPLYGISGLQTIVADLSPDLESLNLSGTQKNLDGEAALRPQESIEASLSWHQAKANAANKVVLRMGCLYEDAAGNIKILDVLDGQPGQTDAPPYIAIAADGADIRLAGEAMNEARRVLLYAYIYAGIAAWEETGGQVLVRQPESPALAIDLGKEPADGRFRALARIEKGTDGEWRIVSAARHYPSRQALAKAYGWDFVGLGK